jgi:CheY-like chemotaxis protein
MSPAQGRLLRWTTRRTSPPLRRVLRSGDWEIRTALDGERALQILEQYAPEVVISDFRLPGMNGADFLAQVKQRMPLAQRIMLTGHADQRAIEEAINRSEIFRFIAKPWNDSALLLTVQSAFEQYASTPRTRTSRGHPGAERGLRALNAELRYGAAAYLAAGRGKPNGSSPSTRRPPAGGGSGCGPQRPPGQRPCPVGRPVQGVSQNPPHTSSFGRDTPAPAVR